MAVEIKIRKAKKEDLGEMAVLIYRLKKLNEEFDTHFKVSSDAEKRIPEYLERILNEPDRFFVIVAAIGSKVVAVLKADVRERISYEPPQDIRITDFYIAPEHRRSGHLLRLRCWLNRPAVKESRVCFPVLLYDISRNFKKLIL